MPLQGRSAVNLFSITNNITSLLLEETLPGEEPVAVQLTEGHTHMRVECVDILALSNATLEVEGVTVATLPDMGRHLDPAVIQEVFLEVISR